MEPNDLNTPPPDDVALEAWMRTSASLPPLPDHGFTQRVLVSLPTPVSRRSTQRLWFCLAGALAGITVAALKITTTTDFTTGLSAITPEAVRSLEQLADPKLLVALAVTAASLIFVFWSDVRRLVRLVRL